MQGIWTIARRGLPLLLLLLLGSVSWADPATAGLRVDHCDKRTDGQSARDLFDRGLTQYEEGDYQGAIDAFVQSYCIKPHPVAFYNIAQGYERLLDFERSIQYFERYIAGVGKNAPNRKKAILRAEVLRNLPAQIRIATVPPNAAITIRNPAGIVARGIANGDQPVEVTQGRYKIAVNLPGYNTLEQELIAKPGQPYSFYLLLESKQGTLQVKSTPANGRIFVNDRLVGVGSYKDTLPVGRYQVTVEAPNRISSTQVVVLRASENRQTSFVLEHPHKSGRMTLAVAASLGLGLTGLVAMSSVFEGADSKAFILTGFGASAALGFGGVFYGVSDSLSQDNAWAIIGGAVVGITEGTIIGSFFGCGSRISECNEVPTLGAALTGGLVGTVAATLGHEPLHLTTGDVTLLVSGGFWGMTAGGLLYAIFDQNQQTRDGLLFAGLNVGLATAAGLVGQSDVSLRRVAIINVAGVVGTLSGASLALAFDSGQERTQHLALFGMLGGLATAAFLTRDMDVVRSTSNEPNSVTPQMGAVRDASGRAVLQFGLGVAF